MTARKEKSLEPRFLCVVSLFSPSLSPLIVLSPTSLEIMGLLLPRAMLRGRSRALLERERNACSTQTYQLSLKLWMGVSGASHRLLSNFGLFNKIFRLSSYANNVGFDAHGCLWHSLSWQNHQIEFCIHCCYRPISCPVWCSGHTLLFWGRGLMERRVSPPLLRIYLLLCRNCLILGNFPDIFSSMAIER